MDPKMTVKTHQSRARLTPRFLAGVLAFSLIADAGFVAPPFASAAPARGKTAASPAPAKAAPEPAQTANPAPAPVPAKEPIIEVSVDSLEISDDDKSQIGVLWNDQILIGETAIPGIFKIGELARVTPIQATINAMIEKRQARVLANPTLMTKSGSKANFLVGGEIPYPTIGQNNTPGIEFKKYGVAMNIEPRITPRQTIEADINVIVSNPDEARGITIQGTLVPALATREANSKVEVKDGETVVLAGIKQSKRDKTVRRVPVLGYIPLLGLLFRYKSETVSQTSLVIFVTFRLVKG